MATRTINTDIKLTGEKAFNDQMKAINSNLKALSAQMRVATTAYNENASASDLLKNQQSVLNAQIDQTKVKVAALEKAYQETASAMGENSGAADKLLTSMYNAQADLNKLEAAQRKLNKELEDAEAAEKAAKDIQELAAAARGADGPIDELGDELRELDDAAGSVNLSRGLKDTLIELVTSGKAGEVAMAAASTAAKGLGYSLAGLGVAGAGASIVITALATVGLKTMAQFAIDAANSGNPAFAGLAENLGLLTEASTAAKTALGGVLLPALEELSGEGAKLLQSFAEEVEAAGSDTAAVGGIIAKYIKEAANAVRDAAPDFIAQGGGLVTGLAEGIVENADDINDAISETLEQLASYLEDNADIIGEAAAVLVSNLGTMIATNAPQLFSAGVTMIENLIAGLDGGQLGQTAADLVLLLLATLIELAPDLFEAGVEFAFEVTKGILEADWAQIGVDIINAIWEGMKSIWQNIVDWFNEKVDSLHGTAYIDVYTRQYGGTIDETGTDLGSHATGLDYVPYDEYPALLHKGEMVVPARLSDQLRSAGIGRNSQNLNNLGGGGDGNVKVDTNVNVTFTGDLAALGRVLQPHIVAEGSRRGPQLIK